MTASEVSAAQIFAWRTRAMSAGWTEGEGRVFDVDLQIRDGERVALLGSDDSGRGVLLRVLAGLRPHREGELEVLGQSVERLPHFADWDQILAPGLRRKIGVCLEVEGLLSNVSVREGLEMLFRFKYGDHTAKLRDAAQRAVGVICENFGLSGSVERRPFLLSPAERRIAGLARAFLSKPRAVLLENPSQNIGDSSRARLWSALRFIADQNRTLVISTDDWAVAGEFCERWVVMDQGRITFDGRPRDFVRGSHPMVDQLRRVSQIHRSYESFLNGDVA